MGCRWPSSWRPCSCASSPPAEVLARLEPALPLLTDGPTDAPDRLRTMRNAIAWSYDLLPPPSNGLRHLSVFVGGCTLGAAEAVVGGSHPPSSAQRVTDPAGTAELHQTLAALVDASLVQRHDTGGETRLTLLETIREFAWGSWWRAARWRPSPPVTRRGVSSRPKACAGRVLCRGGRAWPTWRPSIPTCGRPWGGCWRKVR